MLHSFFKKAKLVIFFFGKISSSLSSSSLGCLLLLLSCTSFLCILDTQFSSVARSCLTLCHPMNHSTPSLPDHHQLLEFTQTHVHRVGDAIQPSHPLSSPSPDPNPSRQRPICLQRLHGPHLSEARLIWRECGWGLWGSI